MTNFFTKVLISKEMPKHKKYGTENATFQTNMRSRWLDIGQVRFFCVFLDRDEVEVHKLAKEERGQYPANLTEQPWSIKDLLYGFRRVRGE